MRELPILFSTDMVKGIMADRKTMTRRVVKGLALQWLDDFTPEFVAHSGNHLCPYGKPGDILWVRETHLAAECLAPSVLYTIYKADVEGPVDWNWRPSIFLHKAAARIWLQIEDLRIERLQDISEEDAIAEGVEPDGDGYKDYTGPAKQSLPGAYWSFNALWCTINDANSWEANPWVWVIKFKVLSKKGKPLDGHMIDGLIGKEVSHA